MAYASADSAGDDVEREAALQAEAASMLADLGLVPLLASYGDPHLVGSLAMGLLVSRDVDFNVLVDRVDEQVFDAAYAAMRPLVAHPRVFRLRYASQLGPFNPDGSKVEEGFYCGVHYRTDAGDDWKIDVWTVQPPRPEIELVARMRQALDPAMRAAILAIKGEMKAKHVFAGTAVHSSHVYHAVLDGVRDIRGLQAWLAERGVLPTSQVEG